MFIFILINTSILIGLRFSAFLNSLSTTLILEPKPFSQVHSKSTAASSSPTSNALGLRSKSNLRHCTTSGENRLQSEVDSVCPEPTSTEIASISYFCWRCLLLSIALLVREFTVDSWSGLRAGFQILLSQILSSLLCILLGSSFPQTQSKAELWGFVAMQIGNEFWILFHLPHIEFLNTQRLFLSFLFIRKGIDLPSIYKINQIF